MFVVGRCAWHREGWPVIARSVVAASQALRAAPKVGEHGMKVRCDLGALHFQSCVGEGRVCRFSLMWAKAREDATTWQAHSRCARLRDNVKDAPTSKSGWTSSTRFRALVPHRPSSFPHTLSTRAPWTTTRTSKCRRPTEAGPCTLAFQTLSACI